MKILFLALSFAFFLVGCSQATKKISLSGPDTNSLKELKSATIETRDEFRLLSKTMEAVAQKSMTKEQHAQRFLNATTVPEGFDKPATFKFTGKSSVAARAIAAAAGYKFVLDGNPLPNEPWVNINIKDEPLNEALKELGMQTGDTARIEVYSKVLRFVYNN